jgi:acyl-[acyl-carrier-protein]-phospholipid O-acyltransferase/long-chain-fatty-acid--[acyl-carrier-protein] ligase
MAYGRVPALLNFTAGHTNLRAALEAAKVRTVITSRRFVKIMNLDSVVQQLGEGVTVIYAEDIRDNIRFMDKLRGMLDLPFVRQIYGKLGVRPNDPAVVLFTSGSESAPKGVVLSHKNILANRYQIGTRIDLNASDILFNALPIFHSFGLSVGLFLPLLTGVKVYLYPSPLHYRIIPEILYATNATILISTDTFLANYARHAHAYDFCSLRYVVAGGEKLKDETRLVWFEKFGIRILEGYGVTETSPVLAISTPMFFKTGTVGHLVPGTEHQLRPVDGLPRGGSLIVRGPNVMLGYLKSDRPGVLQPPYNGWYDTGDVVEIDSDGFVKIIGRAKRFAKIGGEMVSLAAVETYIQAAYPDKDIAVVAAPDPRKGEKLVLFTNEPRLTRDGLIDLAHDQGVPEIMIPKQSVVLDELPRLGTGKFDYVKLNAMAITETTSAMGTH